eukprot:scaffold76095_cov36-Phaeocystis_antarctica.AAC.1
MPAAATETAAAGWAMVAAATATAGWAAGAVVARAAAGLGRAALRVASFLQTGEWPRVPQHCASPWRGGASSH